MSTFRHIIRFIRVLHRNNSDTFDPFYFRLDPKDWFRGLPEVLRTLWDTTR